MFNIFKKKKSLELMSPMTGTVISIDQVPIKFFRKDDRRRCRRGSDKGSVVAPCNGTISQIFPTNHAIGIETEEGLEILIHIGIDTVELKGEGFKRLLEPGTKVSVGDAIVDVDLDFLKSKGKELATPVVVTNMEKVEKIDVVETSCLAGKSKIITVYMN